MLKIDAANILFTVINLLILFVAMKFILFKPVQKIIDARQAEADKQFDEAAQKKKDAEEMQVQYQASLDSISEERKQTIREAKKEADVQYQKIVGDAEETARKIKQDAVTEAETQKAQILRSAERDIANIVADAATKVVGSKSGAEIDASLFDEFLDKAGDKS